MQKLSLTEFAQELNIRLAQEDIINSVEAPFSERFWRAENKLEIWVLPAVALAAHFWFICFLDLYYNLGWSMAIHITDPQVFELLAWLTVLWVIFAPTIVAGVIGFISFNNDWDVQRRDYFKQLEKAVDAANRLRHKAEDRTGTTLRDFHEANRRQVRLVLGLSVPGPEELTRPANDTVPYNPHHITLEMIGVEQEEIRGASCMMPKI